MNGEGRGRGYGTRHPVPAGPVDPASAPRETIYALSSGPVRAGVAVVRLSGPGALTALSTLSGPVPPARRAVLRTLRDPRDGEPLDEALVLAFPGPGSFTGEDVAELHLHGGRATVAGVLDALGRLPGLRPAEAGEFARRAFTEGRLDLTAAEALADLIDAETSAQRRQALRGASGALTRAAEAWRAALLGALALVEASLDFADEGDVMGGGAGEGLLTEAMAAAAGVRAALDAALDGAAQGERLREGFRVALVGPPNAGKSSLLNALVRRDLALVSPVPGTTRDAIEASLDLDGLPVTLVDTAGLRETSDEVERLGVDLARRTARGADLVLRLRATGEGPSQAPPLVQGPSFGSGQDGDGAGEMEAMRATDLGHPAPLCPDELDVTSKIDLGTIDLDRPLPAPHGLKPLPTGANRSSTVPGFRVSARTGEGLDALRAELARRAALALGDGRDALVTRARQRAALAEARGALDGLGGAPFQGGPAMQRAGPGLEGCPTSSPDRVHTVPELPAPELASEALRIALNALGRLVGRVGPEEVLDAVFGRFCIGK